MLRAIIFDLDDTLISAYSNPGAAWAAIAAEFADDLHPHDPETIAVIVAEGAAGFLGDDENRRRWRLDAIATRREVVRAAVRDHDVPDAVADDMADRYATYRDENMHLFEGALHVLDALHANGLKLGLLTNGAALVQRKKIERFELTARFDAVAIEEDAGFGKPDERAYRAILSALDVDPEDAAMVGDDLPGDIEASQRLGLTGIWHDRDRRGLSPNAAVQPDHTIVALNELLSLI